MSLGVDEYSNACVNVISLESESHANANAMILTSDVGSQDYFHRSARGKLKRALLFRPGNGGVKFMYFADRPVACDGSFAQASSQRFNLPPARQKYKDGAGGPKSFLGGSCHLPRLLLILHYTDDQRPNDGVVDFVRRARR